MVAVVVSADEVVGAACASALADLGHEVCSEDAIGAGPVDVLVVVAPLGQLGSPAASDPTGFAARALDLADRAIEAMVAAGSGGRVVVVVGPGALPGADHRDRLAAVSGSLVAYARAAAREVADRGVTVNVVRAGLLDTPALADAAERDAAVADAVATVVARSPLSRRPTPADIADAVAFLASPHASYVTGIVLPVDAGLTIGQGT